MLTNLALDSSELIVAADGFRKLLRAARKTAHIHIGNRQQPLDDALTKVASGARHSHRQWGRSRHLCDLV